MDTLFPQESRTFRSNQLFLQLEINTFSYSLFCFNIGVLKLEVMTIPLEQNPYSFSSSTIISINAETENQSAVTEEISTTMIDIKSYASQLA
ncbi:hypothetical protein [Peribacillus sp. TH24]|uniref:hypothetical protein n=1 Tax=Peribacillus sp. TH24 TaxID=2798483 RepID=UPI0019113567|nr:hypothetical protein [Peribacillus sp. TH24]MBK5441495.1 hypothetical protein [Peribacillus sp. TH24]